MKAETISESYLQVGDMEIRANDIEEYVKEHNNMKKEIERLNNIINKAREYIEENKTIHECNEYGFDNMLEDVIPLLNILKGIDKE